MRKIISFPITLLLLFIFTSTASAFSTEIVLYASKAPLKAGNWTVASDSSAAGGSRLANPDTGAAKLAAPLATPTDYFEMDFYAEAGKAYRLWIRGKSQSNATSNDSVYVQFNGSVDSAGVATSRIGSTSGWFVIIQDCSSCSLSGWGWQDNGWGVNTLGPYVYFATTGQQKLRIQRREDGISIDQIVLSPLTYLNSSPGELKNDTIILPENDGIANLSPSVSVTASVGSTTSSTSVTGMLPLGVNFNTNATDADGSISSYRWEFGDGQTSTLSSPSHTYNSAGTYTARVTVTDNEGAQASDSVLVTVTSSSGAKVKVLTWNIHKGVGTDNVKNLERTADYIKRYNPDVALLQEVMNDYWGDQGAQLVTLMQERTGVTWYKFWARKTSGNGEGSLILSKYPLSNTTYKYLSYQRVVAKASITVGGRTINVFSTHFDSGSQDYRLVQANEVISFAASFPESRIIGGDFNAWSDQSSISAMLGHYYDAWSVALAAGSATSYTDNPVNWNTRTRSGRIDYIFHSKGATSLKLLSAQTPDIRNLSQTNVKTLIGTLDDKGVRPSDHNLVVVTYEVR